MNHISGKSAAVVWLAVQLCSACSGGETATSESDAGEIRWEPAPDQAVQYTKYIAPSLIGRVVSVEEEEKLEAGKPGALRALLEDWTQEDGFVESARSMIETELNTSGINLGTDFNLPGQLVEHVVRHELPWSEVLTSDTCYGSDDKATDCDTGVAYAAGVLNTRGFLVANEGYFNARRAAAMFRTFACRHYPHEQELTESLPKADLLPLFQAESPDALTVNVDGNVLRNGDDCYACHSQLALHAQLFVKFDDMGAWNEDATGEQAPMQSLGASFDGLSASHLEDAEAAASEKSEFFGDSVNDLGEAAAVFAKHDVFFQCSALRLLGLGLGLERVVFGGEADTSGAPRQAVDPELIAAITQRSLDDDPDPTLSALAVEAFSDQQVIETTLASLNATP